ncbi:ABC transporter permease, partial [Candidatus Zixiibacteriota bacterium]
GLMVRTFLILNEVHPGFDSVDVHTARVWIPPARYSEDGQVIRFYSDVIERMEAGPGIDGAGVVLSPPINYSMSGTLVFSIMDRPVDTGEQSVAGYQLVSDDYFQIMKIPLLSGRMLESTDDENSPHVAMINQALADELWPEENPIGKQVTWGDPADPETVWAEIVGVVGNTVFESLDSEPRTEIFRPFSQAPMAFMTMVIRSRADSETVFSMLRQVVADIDPDQPVIDMVSMEEVVSTSLAQRRFNMQLLALFALIALIMAAVGLYGVLSFTVAQRSSEIGVRMAVGAGSSNIISLIIRDGFQMVLIGLGVGIMGSLLLAQVVSNMVYGINTFDPLSLISGMVLLAAVAMMACLIPAWRATRVNPTVVLNRE